MEQNAVIDEILAARAYRNGYQPPPAQKPENLFFYPAPFPPRLFRIRFIALPRFWKRGAIIYY
jgi:hypothetical protein